jgi:hypothetical protein
MAVPEIDLGYMVNGVVTYDPHIARFVLVVDENSVAFDTQQALKKYEGKEVRFTLASMETIANLTELVQSGEVPIEDAKIGG